MKIHHLVKIANGIGSFHESETERKQGAKGIAAHLRSFWNLRMRRELFSYLDCENGEGLRPRP
jgi:formate dehydrogenase subunit delta